MQEFQISTSNFDLSTGIAAFGAINIVTRSGSNDYRGAGYYYFRNNDMASYPSLNRSLAQRQPGVLAQTGRLRHRRSDQEGQGPFLRAATSAPISKASTSSSRILRRSPGSARSRRRPCTGNQLSGRVDYRINNKHSLFARYSHDGNTNSGPFGIPVPPSNFVSNENYVDQQLVGITSVLSGTLVNDFRFSHYDWRNRNTPAGCDGSINANCIGLGGPEIFYLNSVNFALGNNFNSPQGRDVHRYPISNNTTWQKNAHRVKFGGDVGAERSGRLLGLLRSGAARTCCRPKSLRGCRRAARAVRPA